MRLTYRAVVFDNAGHELVIGDDALFGWTFEGSLQARPYPGCSDVIPSCPARSAGFAVAGSPGSGLVAVVFHGLRALSATTVIAR